MTGLAKGGGKAVSTALATLAIIFVLAMSMVWMGYMLALNAQQQAQLAGRAETAALKAKELIRVYIWMLPVNQTGTIYNVTQISLKNEWSGETTVNHIMLFLKDGGELSTSLQLRLAAGDELTLRPSELGLPPELDDYPTALSRIRYLQAHTTLGNDFVSLWGRPDKPSIVARGGDTVTYTATATATSTATATGTTTTTSTSTILITPTTSSTPTQPPSLSMSYSCQQSGSSIRITIYYSFNPGNPPNPYPPYTITFTYLIGNAGYNGPTYTVNGPASGSWSFSFTGTNSFHVVGSVQNYLGSIIARNSVDDWVGSDRCPYNPPPTTSTTTGGGGGGTTTLTQYATSTTYVGNVVTQTETQWVTSTITYGATSTVTTYTTTTRTWTDIIMTTVSTTYTATVGPTTTITRITAVTSSTFIGTFYHTYRTWRYGVPFSYDGEYAGEFILVGDLGNACRIQPSYVFYTADAPPAYAYNRYPTSALALLAGLLVTSLDRRRLLAALTAASPFILLSLISIGYIPGVAIAPYTTTTIYISTVTITTTGTVTTTVTSSTTVSTTMSGATVTTTSTRTSTTSTTITWTTVSATTTTTTTTQYTTITTTSTITSTYVFWTPVYDCLKYGCECASATTPTICFTCHCWWDYSCAGTCQCPGGGFGCFTPSFTPCTTQLCYG